MRLLYLSALLLKILTMLLLLISVIQSDVFPAYRQGYFVVFYTTLLKHDTR